jgi:hypothetical protein
MKKVLSFLFMFFVCVSLVFAQAGIVETPKAAKIFGNPKIILFIAEQNIDAPRSAWWASEVDLSSTEAAVAKSLLEEGFDIVEPGLLGETLEKDKAFRMVDIAEKDSLKLAQVAKADYVITGKAVASAGGTVPQSSMRSCFANMTVKLIDVKAAKTIAYIDAAGNSVHMDVITGGREALVSAAKNIAPKIIEALKKQIQALKTVAPMVS